MFGSPYQSSQAPVSGFGCPPPPFGATSAPAFSTTPTNVFGFGFNPPPAVPHASTPVPSAPAAAPAATAAPASKPEPKPKLVLSPVRLTGPGPFTVMPGDPQPTDNTVLDCSGGQRIFTNADLLRMISPGTLGPLAAAAAAAGAAEAVSAPAAAASSTATSDSEWSAVLVENFKGGSLAAPEPAGNPATTATTAATTATTEAAADAAAAEAEAATDGGHRLHLSMSQDSATDWMVALKLVHPAVLPADRPLLDWATTERVLKLADKHRMSSVMALCSDALVSFLGDGAGAPTAVAPLMDMLSTALRLQQKDLVQACCEVITKRLQEAERTSTSPDVAFLKEMKAWLLGKASSSQGDVGFSMASLLIGLYEGACGSLVQQRKL